MSNLRVIVAPESRDWCGGVEGRTHVRDAGGACKNCNDYRPDWRWEVPRLATAFDDGAASERARIVAWLRSYDDVQSRSALAARIEKGEHVGATGTKPAG